MSERQNHPAWMDDELVRGIPREKLELLSKMHAEAEQFKSSGTQKNPHTPKMGQKEMLMQFMPLLKQMKSSGLSFTPQEIQASIAAIKKHSTEEELHEIDKILKNADKKES